jgi:hypothetical protein
MIFGKDSDVFGFGICSRPWHSKIYEIDQALAPRRIEVSPPSNGGFSRVSL